MAVVKIAVETTKKGDGLSSTVKELTVVDQKAKTVQTTMAGFGKVAAVNDGVTRSFGSMADSVGRVSTTLARSADVFGLNAAALRAIDDAADVAELGFNNLSTAAAGFNAASVGIVGAGLAIGTAIGNLLNKFQAVRDAADAATAPIAKLWLSILGEGGKKDSGWAPGQLEAVQAAYKNVQATAAATGPAIDKLAESQKKLGAGGSKAADDQRKLTEEMKRQAVEAKRLSEVQKLIADNRPTLKALDPWKGIEIPSPFEALGGQEALTAAIDAAREKTVDVTVETFNWSQALQDVNNTMELLGISSDSTMGMIIGGMTAAAAAGDSLKKALADGATSQQKFAAAMQGIGVAVSAFKNKSILGGAAQGAAFGASFGPLGALIGGGAGALIGGIGKLFGGGEIGKVNDMRDAFFEAQGGFVALGQKLQSLGDQSLVKKIFDAKSVEQFNAAVGEVNGLLGLQGQSQEALQQAVDRYGFSISELGPKFRQQELDTQAGQLLQDFRLLTASGIETGLVIQKMGPAMVEFVNTARTSGATIPEAMRPMVDQLIQSGQLLDANGTAFQSAEAAGITFAETMTESVSRMITSIDQLVAALTGIPNVSRTVTVNTVNTGGGGVPGGAGGGGVPTGVSGPGSGGRFGSFASGIDYVPRDMPAFVHKGEAVLKPAEAAAYRSGGGKAFSYTAPSVVINAGNMSVQELGLKFNAVVRGNEKGAVTRMRKALATRG